MRFFTLCFLFFLLIASSAQAQADLKMIIGDIEDFGGKLRVFVHNEQTYPIEEEAVLELQLKPRTGDLVHYITGLKPGRYAIVVHHDENEDDDFNTNQFGMGEEGIGFTEDPRLDFGMPEFQDVWFEYDGKSGYAIVYMTY